MVKPSKPTAVNLQLAARCLVHPEGRTSDVLVQVDKFVYPIDFIILDFEADENVPILLGRPFLATGRTLIDVYKGELTMRMNDQQIKFNNPKAMGFSYEPVEVVIMIKTIDHLALGNQQMKDQVRML